ncbi:MAG: preprotein translocase subunit YajC [Pseudomonadota bacterium]
MFITPAHAQAAGGGGPDLLITFIPFILIFVIFYFLLIRPQQKRQREHREMLAALRRGDNIVTAGGMVGKISKVIDDNEIEVEIAKDVRIRVMRAFVSEVRAKGEPAKEKT